MCPALEHFDVGGYSAKDQIHVGDTLDIRRREITATGNAYDRFRPTPATRLRRKAPDPRRPIRALKRFSTSEYSTRIPKVPT
jgi:hypothetical protein